MINYFIDLSLAMTISENNDLIFI